MSFLSSLVITFSMYSRIPMPMVDWNKKNMQWIFSCFPLVGVVIGLVLFFWIKIAVFLSVTHLVVGTFAAFLPIVLTGGIHLDGLCDTCDALGSHQSRERKLEILKDSYIGAFGVIACIMYLIMLCVCWCSVNLSEENTIILCSIPLMSRCWVALAAVTRKNARKSGLLASFTSVSAGKICIVIDLLWCVIISLLFLFWGLVGQVMFGTVCLISIWFYRMSEVEFGGITGDLAGWYLQMLELGMIMSAVFVGGI